MRAPEPSSPTGRAGDPDRSGVDYAAFLNAADAGQLGPVTLLHGPEPFLLEDAAQRVTAALFPVSAPAGGDKRAASPSTSRS